MKCLPQKQIVTLPCKILVVLQWKIQLTGILQNGNIALFPG